MSDIPLRTFRRSRNSRSGYAPLRTEQDEDDADANQQTMPAQTTITKAAVSAASQRWKGKRKQNYKDDPEEHEGLLGDDGGHDSEEEVRGAGPARSPVCEVCSTRRTF